MAERTVCRQTPEVGAGCVNAHVRIYAGGAGKPASLPRPLARHPIRNYQFSDSKTGPRAVPLGEAAQAVVEALPGPRDPDAFLFPKNAGRQSSHNIVACWRAVCDDARLGRLRLHDLRHTAASQAVMSGENLPLVGKLLGHRRHRTTAGYAHLSDGHLVEAAETVGTLIADAMRFGPRVAPGAPGTVAEAARRNRGVAI